jgi:hypothetical protein
MLTLDDILTENLRDSYKDKLEKILNPADWTVENRDSKFEETRKVTLEVVDESLNFVRNVLLDTEVNGKPILYWKMAEQAIVSELELLLSMRDELDTSDEVAIPIDHAWLNIKIKNAYKELKDLNSSLEKALEPTTEEL